MHIASFAGKQRKYQENGNIKSKPIKFDRTSSPIQMTQQDMIDTLVNAGYIIKKKEVRGAYSTHVFRVINIFHRKSKQFRNFRDYTIQ